MRYLFFLLALATFTLGSCRDKKPETKEVVREVHVEKTVETPKNEGILERAGKKVDKKVNEKIDEKIDDID